MFKIFSPKELGKEFAKKNSKCCDANILDGGQCENCGADTEELDNDEKNDIAFSERAEKDAQRIKEQL